VESINKSDQINHLIVGASRGIGRSLLDLSVDAGHQVYALARTKPENAPEGCTWIQGDAENPDSFMDQLPEEINALTFCPGKVILGPIKRLRKEQMLDAYKTSVLDAFTLIQSLIPRLEGSIALLSSVAARTGLPNHCAISAAKSGLEGFAIALAADLAPKVRVNVVAPTLTPTEMGLAMVGGDKMIPMIEERHPLKKIPSVCEIASTISFLHSESAASITGQIFKVDSGLSQLRLNS
jgi:3-oxoacyl-[acyl-carrier protein] reductase|tara:strand:+ start:1188 stop:1901 length:714 start_codon:yes stop_codon:yes gene_type:complete